jgi:hypothetical protein
MGYCLSPLSGLRLQSRSGLYRTHVKFKNSPPSLKNLPGAPALSTPRGARGEDNRRSVEGIKKASESSFE